MSTVIIREPLIRDLKNWLSYRESKLIRELLILTENTETPDFVLSEQLRQFGIDPSQYTAIIGPL